MRAKLASRPATLLLALSALAISTLNSVEPAGALDRLLMLGEIPLRNWLDDTCNAIDKMNADELEARRKRIVNLQNEARSNVDSLAETLAKAMTNYENALPETRATAKAIQDRAYELLLDAKKTEWTLNEKVPVLMRCIATKKADLQGPSLPVPVTPIQCRLDLSSMPKVGGKFVGKLTLKIATDVNTPCEINFATLLAVGLTGTTNSALNSQIANAISDVRLEEQPSRGSASWQDPVLTYTPPEDYKGFDRFTMSQARRTAVEGETVLTGGRDIVTIDVDVQGQPAQ